MLYIDVGNTLRGGLRTGIQRVVRSLAFELAREDRLRETASGARLEARGLLTVFEDRIRQ
jgi:hypothetical protein